MKGRLAVATWVAMVVLALPLIWLELVHTGGTDFGVFPVRTLEGDLEVLLLPLARVIYAFFYFVSFGLVVFAEARTKEGSLPRRACFWALLLLVVGSLVQVHRAAEARAFNAREADLRVMRARMARPEAREQGQDNLRRCVVEESQHFAGRPLELPLNPFANAATGDWTELRCAKSTLRLTVVGIAASTVTVHAVRRDETTGKLLERRSATFSSTATPTVEQFIAALGFPETFVDLNGVSTVDEPYALRGIPFHCKKVSFSRKLNGCQEPAVLWLSTEITGIGLAAVDLLQSGEAKAFLVGHGTTDAAACSPQMVFPWKLFETASAGDWTALEARGPIRNRCLIYTVDRVEPEDVAVKLEDRTKDTMQAPRTVWFSRREPATIETVAKLLGVPLGGKPEPGSRTVGKKSFDCTRFVAESSEAWFSREVKGVGVVGFGNGSPNEGFDLVGYGTRNGVSWGRRPD